MRQSLFVVQFPANAPVSQVDDFAPNCLRSREGSLHVRPGGTAELTQMEIDHIKTSHPALGKGMRVLHKVAPPPLPSAGTPEAVKAAAVLPKPTAEARAKTKKAEAKAKEWFGDGER